MGSIECVQFLLGCNVNLDGRDRSDMTPEMCADISNQDYIVELMEHHRRLRG